MSKRQFGELPPRYSFLLNPYVDVRLSKCPACDGLTHYRKFVLCIHIDGFGLMGLGKTCRYCTPCEIIIAHQDELELQLWHRVKEIAPLAVGNKYLVMGTTEKKFWQQQLTAAVESNVAAYLSNTAQFKKQLELKVSSSGWGPPARPKRSRGATGPRRP